MFNLNLTTEREAVIVSLNTELYMYKCMVLTLQIENTALLARLATIDAALCGLSDSVKAAGF